MPVLADLLRDLGLGSARVGLETDYLPARDMERLSSSFRTSDGRPCYPIFNRLRMIKTPRELELMRKLARITDRSIKEALESVHAGDTEMDLAGAVTTEPVPLRGPDYKWLILASGERSQFPNVGPDASDAGARATSFGSRCSVPWTATTRASAGRRSCRRLPRKSPGSGRTSSSAAT